jgi:peroxiredoxin
VERLSARFVSTKRTDQAHPPGRMRRLIVFEARASGDARRPRAIFRRRRVACLVFFGLITAALVLVSNHRSPGLDRKPGQVIAEFELVDARTGQINRASDYRGRVLVIVFLGTSCPVGDLYMPRLVDLALRNESRNVEFLGINSNDSDSIEDVADHARRSRAVFPIMKDTGNRVADQLLAERTCEALVIDDRGRLRYRGAIDDQYGLGSRREQPVHHYLTDAIDAVLAGRRVSTEMTQVVGCPIERKAPPKARRSLTRRGSTPGLAIPVHEPASPSPLLDNAEPVTYARDVARILHARCASCHRQGQVAPFSLLTFDQAHRWAASIGEVIADNRMPPWHADPRYGHFANDRSLTARERSVLNSWIQQGTPPGNLALAPEPPKYPQGWSIGTPDLVYEMPETFVVQATGTVPIKHFRLKTTHTEDLYIQAAEARPGDRAVVHHICIYIDDHKKNAVGTRNKNLLVAYTPGDMPSVYSPGIAKKIAPGTDLIFEVHYTPIGQLRFDRTSVGVILAKEPPRHLAVTRGIAGWGLKIPPGAPDHVQRAAWPVHSDLRLLSMTPHMHLRGKSFHYSAQYPDGRDEILLSVPDYDFNWQSVYRLTEPKPLPKGTVIHCEAHFDNSAANSANPDPGQTVLWGEQTEDEMMIGFIDYYEDTPVTSASISQHGDR